MPRIAEGAFEEPSEENIYQEIVTIVESYEAGSFTYLVAY